MDSANDIKTSDDGTNKKRLLSTNPNKFYVKNYENQKIKFLQMMNDPNNPYSTFWPNKILEKRYNLEIAVNGYINGVPVIKLIKKRDTDLPAVKKSYKIS
jgi:hypothetical protein